MTEIVFYKLLIGHTSNLNTKGDVGTYHSVFIPIPLLSNLESFQHTTFPRQMPTACYKLNTVSQTQQCVRSLPIKKKLLELDGAA